jgi:hypothetical protein
MTENEGRKMKRSHATSSRRQLRDVPKAGATDRDLPLVHITAVGAAREIVDGGQIEMRPCPVFHKDLAYFFALRPAYRLKNGTEKSDRINRFPCVFVVSPAQLGVPFHVYPFDTGAAVDGRYADRADEWVYLEDYELEPALDAAAHHIDWAFGSLEAYFDGELKTGVGENLPSWRDVVRSYVDIAGLAGSGGTNQPDRRASAIELAYRKNVPLKGHVKLIVIPKQYLEDGTTENRPFLEKLEAAKVEWETYDWQPNSTPDEFQDEIARAVLRHFSGLKLF